MPVSTDYTSNANNSPADAPAMKTGKLTMAGSLTAGNYIVLAVGFTPRYIKVMNVTQLSQFEWFEGMTFDTCLRTVSAGTRTLQTTNKGLGVCDSTGTEKSTGRYISLSQNATLAAATANDVLYWYAVA